MGVVISKVRVNGELDDIYAEVVNDRLCLSVECDPSFGNTVASIDFFDLIEWLTKNGWLTIAAGPGKDIS